MMEESVTLKKILFRQNQLSDLVSYENRSKYSTLFEGKPRKSRSYKHSYSREPALSQELEKKLVGLISGSKLEEAPPQFNNFNYTDFLRQGVEDEPVAAQLNEEEERVARLTHVKLNESQQSKNRDKSIRLRSFSKEISTRAKMTLDCFATVDSLSNKMYSILYKEPWSNHCLQSTTSKNSSVMRRSSMCRPRKRGWKISTSIRLNVWEEINDGSLCIISEGIYISSDITEP
jgi:hypothetical protein